MRKQRLQFGIVSLLFLTAACAVCSQWLRGPVVHAAIQPLGFVTDDDGSLVAHFRFTNAGSGSLWYTGYGHECPWYSQSLQIDGRWTDPGSQFWCGTGATIEELPAGESLLFDVPLVRGSTGMMVGIDVRLRNPRDGDPDSETDVQRVEIWSKSLPIHPSARELIDGPAPLAMR